MAHVTFHTDLHITNLTLNYISQLMAYGIETEY